MFGNRMSKVLALAIASPTNAPSVRIFFCRSSGWKGLPFSMPSGLSIAMKKRSRSSAIETAIFCFADYAILLGTPPFVSCRN
jgi:hypothetical protein